ncbi:type IV conjugative transfer system protein TraL [Escherichia coli]|nr:type IV conjugative transfer system protein TraL [Escherichia coli]
MFAGKKSAQIREILINESAWEEMTCLFAPSLVLWGFFAKKYVFGLIIATVVWQLIRAAKRGKSSRWLYNWCYWHLPVELFRVVYRVIPDSSYRKWIK